jgi:hypothetical protein
MRAIGMKCSNGEKSLAYGIWKSLCCGQEIVLYGGTVFPLCKKHRASTEWVLISTTWFSKPRGESEHPHISTERLQCLSIEGVVSDRFECAHLTACWSCRTTLEEMALKHHSQRLYERAG